jgi:hypothetical protein
MTCAPATCAPEHHEGHDEEEGEEEAKEGAEA